MRALLALLDALLGVWLFLALFTAAVIFVGYSFVWCSLATP